MTEILGALGTGMPWWAACLVVAFTSLIFFCLRALRLLIPDKSSDRLAWWIAVLEHRRRSAGTAARRRRVAGKDRKTHRRSHKTRSNSA
ncbi:hypothetical protein DY245_03025 [Streptomyces inhibens]|uniref:Uncharacterized protein n=1 Tax=Streptomyces inhibens TaxID=2293571 RepID=A0A371QAH5_STRIH|nr:hypothetical protein DY245_03025 [Streptomyces inhibens]